MPRLHAQANITTSPTHILPLLHAYLTQPNAVLKPLNDDQYSYVLAGIPLKGEYDILAHEPHAYLHARTRSGIQADLEIIIDGTHEGALVTVLLEYQLPGALLGGMTNRLVLEQQIQHDIDTVLAWLAERTLNESLDESQGEA
jgi:uncharacterized membrane protein